MVERQWIPGVSAPGPQAIKQARLGVHRPCIQAVRAQHRSICESAKSAEEIYVPCAHDAKSCVAEHSRQRGWRVTPVVPSGPIKRTKEHRVCRNDDQEMTARRGEDLAHAGDGRGVLRDVFPDVRADRILDSAEHPCVVPGGMAQGVGHRFEASRRD